MGFEKEIGGITVEVEETGRGNPRMGGKPIYKYSFTKKTDSEIRVYEGEGLEGWHDEEGMFYELLGFLSYYAEAEEWSEEWPQWVRKWAEDSQDDIGMLVYEWEKEDEDE